MVLVSFFCWKSLKPTNIAYLTFMLSCDDNKTYITYIKIYLSNMKSFFHPILKYRVSFWFKFFLFIFAQIDSNVTVSIWALFASYEPHKRKSMSNKQYSLDLMILSKTMIKTKKKIQVTGRNQRLISCSTNIKNRSTYMIKILIFLYMKWLIV